MKIELQFLLIIQALLLMETLDGIITENLVYTATHRPTELEKLAIVCFLHELMEDHHHSKEFIRRALDYSIKDFLSFGGFTIVNKIGSKIVSASIINQTGMQGYVADNIIVYFGIHPQYRGNGICRRMIEQVKSHAKGDIALHLKNDPSVISVFEKYGFSNSIIELRLHR